MENKSNSHTNIFNKDIKLTQDKIKNLRSKYKTDEDMYNSAEWKEFKASSAYPINDIVNKND
jgi:hypothetical protein